jgi:PEP-CTERM motif
MVRSLVFCALVAVAVFAVRWISDFPAAPGSGPGTSSKLQSFQFNQSAALLGIQGDNRRLVYPYSVIPGGIRSAGELREAASHDPLVASHYAGFDYARAHLVEVDRPRLVYVSYRRGGQIHWTSKQATLHPGEKLLTDGRITARTRCGNQVSVLPQANTLPNEPTLAELERPDAVASGTAQLFPSNSNSLLLDPLTTLGPGPGGLYAGAPQPGGFMPMPIAGGGIGPIATPVNGNCPKNEDLLSAASKDCHKPPPTPPPPPEVPEPGTVVLVMSGAAAIFARYRNQR